MFSVCSKLNFVHLIISILCDIITVIKTGSKYEAENKLVINTLSTSIEQMPLKLFGIEICSFLVTQNYSNASYISHLELRNLHIFHNYWSM